MRMGKRSRAPAQAAHRPSAMISLVGKRLHCKEEKGKGRKTIHLVQSSTLQLNKQRLQMERVLAKMTDLRMASVTRQNSWNEAEMQRLRHLNKYPLLRPHHLAHELWPQATVKHSSSLGRDVEGRKRATGVWFRTRWPWRVETAGSLSTRNVECVLGVEQHGRNPKHDGSRF
jgi:hypothetical protein